MQITELKLDGVKLILPDVFHDDRGFFMESYSAYKYIEKGIDAIFTQDNHSRSFEGVIRGLHFQLNPGQVKLVRVTYGSIFDVVVDVRPDSPTFGQWVGEHLSASNYRQLYIPVGFAHGFCVTSAFADVVYKVNVPYNPEAEKSIAFDDPEIGIKWPDWIINEAHGPIVSARDRSAMSLAEYKNSFLS